MGKQVLVTCSRNVAVESIAQVRLETAFFVENLLVRIHLIIEMILVDRPCAIGI